MSALEQVKQMQSQGLEEQQIVQNLQDQGVAYREISEALSQSKIKAAVEAPANGMPEQTQPLSENPQQPMASPVPSSAESSQVQEISAPSPISTPEQAQEPMQQSIMQTTQENEQQQDYQNEQIPAYDYSGERGYEDYQQYAPSGGGISADTITEISEQVVSEKFSDVRKHLEKVIDFKNTFETKVESLDERLKRMEKIIDTLHPIGSSGCSTFFDVYL